MYELIPTPFGTLRIAHPPGTFAPSPATRVMVRAITDPSRRLDGAGLDWGCGTGTLTIAAAMRPEVEHVIGLDISDDEIRTARGNARGNDVASKARFFLADGYQPMEDTGRKALAALRGSVAFITANPPASTGDDGFSFRHQIIRGAAGMLAPGGILLMQALSAYGPQRVLRLLDTAPGFTYHGVVVSSPAVALELERSGLIRQVQDYVAEEARGGLPYHFEDAAGQSLTATVALARYRAEGTLPLGRWQVHQFRRSP